MAVGSRGVPYDNKVYCFNERTDCYEALRYLLFYQQNKKIFQKLMVSKYEVLKLMKTSRKPYCIFTQAQQVLCIHKIRDYMDVSYLTGFSTVTTRQVRALLTGKVSKKVLCIRESSQVLRRISSKSAYFLFWFSLLCLVRVSLFQRDFAGACSTQSRDRGDV